MKLRKIKTETETEHYFVDEQGILQGEWKSWYENGQKRAIAHSRDGEFHGEYKGWHGNGQQSVICHFRDGNFHGEYKWWNLNGVLVDHTFKIDGEEIIDFLENPELYPTTPEEKTMFVLKYGNVPFIQDKKS